MYSAVKDQQKTLGRKPCWLDWKNHLVYKQIYKSLCPRPLSIRNDLGDQSEEADLTWVLCSIVVVVVVVVTVDATIPKWK